MKKTLTIAAVALISASAFAQTVTSANIVGYVKVDAVGQELTLPGSQFITGTGNTITETLGTNVLLGTKVFGYDAASQSYKGGLTFDYLVTSEFDFITFETILTTNGVGWTEGVDAGVSDRILNIGEAFWLQGGGASGTTNEIVISGEVIVDVSVTNNILPGLNLIASPYSAETAITNFGFNAELGDAINRWNGSGYAGKIVYDYIVTSEFDFITFETIFTTNGVGWTEGVDAGVTTETIGVGEGFWYESAASTTNEWVMNRPFDLD